MPRHIITHYFILSVAVLGVEMLNHLDNICKVIQVGQGIRHAREMILEHEQLFLPLVI